MKTININFDISVKRFNRILYSKTFAIVHDIPKAATVEVLASEGKSGNIAVREVKKDQKQSSEHAHKFTTFVVKYFNYQIYREALDIRRDYINALETATETQYIAYWNLSENGELPEKFEDK